ncbi:MAG: hypothetical protein ACYCPS_05765, partial [Candidatus Saccharimonadales bacterium]
MEVIPTLRFYYFFRSASKTGSASPRTFVASAKRTMRTVSSTFSGEMSCIFALSAILRVHLNLSLRTCVAQVKKLQTQGVISR